MIVESILAAFVDDRFGGSLILIQLFRLCSIRITGLLSLPGARQSRNEKGEEEKLSVVEWLLSVCEALYVLGL